MSPHSKHRPLFFTPRSPWGGRLESQSFRRHMRASEDSDIVRQPGNPAPSVKEQLQKDIDWNRKQGYTSDRDLTLQQKYERDNLMRDTFPSAPATKPKTGWGVSGELSYGRSRPKDGPTEASAEAVLSSNQPMKDKLDDEEEAEKPTSPNGNGEEQKPRPTR